MSCMGELQKVIYNGQVAGVVVADQAVLCDVLAEDEAIWVRPGDAAGLAAGIRRLAAAPALARGMGARLREKARGYTWRVRAEHLAQLLRGLPD